MVSKTGKKATNAAEKARQTHKPDAAQRKMAACRRKLLTKNDRKRKSREARQVKLVADHEPATLDQPCGPNSDSYTITI